MALRGRTEGGRVSSEKRRKTQFSSETRDKLLTTCVEPSIDSLSKS